MKMIEYGGVFLLEISLPSIEVSSFTFSEAWGFTLVPLICVQEMTFECTGQQTIYSEHSLTHYLAMTFRSKH